MSSPLIDSLKTRPSFERILVTNDDGILAPGLKVLEKIAKKLSKDVWVVAPETNQTAASHSLTVSRPLRLRKVKNRHYSVDGTPTDCVLLALNHLLKDKRPTLVLSGVNYGENLGESITYSGTVAAAMEATLLGVPAVALSQTVQLNVPICWKTAEHFAPAILKQLVEIGWTEDVLININFPDLDPKAVTTIEITQQGRYAQEKYTESNGLIEKVDPRGDTYFWVGALAKSYLPVADSDISVTYQGGISITPLHLDFTAKEALEKIRIKFAVDKIFDEQ